MLDILHIYHGTSGSAGLYIHEIYQSLKDNFAQQVIVNYYYPFSYGKKVFFRFSELSSPNIIHRINILRLSLRYLELCYSLIYASFYIIIKKPKILNYSFTSQLSLEYLFLVFIKKCTKTRICITAHDTIPLKYEWNSDHQATISKREKFFLIADKIIVHNQNSFNDLVNFYKIDPSKIIKHPFPVMDLNQLEFPNLPNNINDLFDEAKISFVFVGHGRKEKGLDVLLEAWNDISLSNDNVELFIAGNISQKLKNNLQRAKGLNIIDRFLNDKEYRYIIQNADCVILPYTQGSNSGIPSSVLALKTKLITSDLPMFADNELIDKKFIFQNKKADDLITKMDDIINNKTQFNFPDFTEYNSCFTEKINKQYKSMLNEAAIKG